MAVERLSPSPPWIAVGSGLRGASELLESAGVDRGGGAAMIAGFYEYLNCYEALRDISGLLQRQSGCDCRSAKASDVGWKIDWV